MLHAVLAFFLGATPHCDLIVETFDGQVYVIGSGATCADAAKDRGALPENWRELRFDKK